MSVSELTYEYRNNLVDRAHECIFSDDGKRGYDYLINRGIKEKTIKEWKLGYCPDSVRHIIFNDRIIIPYLDHHSYLRAVAARKVENEKPVWWNEKFDKSNYLFGLSKAKESIFRYNFAIVMEGQFDVISCHQSGLKMSVGVCGKAFTQRHTTLLSRYCNRIVLAYDVDENNSGQTASQKAFEFLKDKDFHIFKWHLPRTKDPDEYVRDKGGKHCMEEIKQILDKYKFKSRKNHTDIYYGD